MIEMWIGLTMECSLVCRKVNQDKVSMGNIDYCELTDGGLQESGLSRW